jgi:hypothetical protein
LSYSSLLDRNDKSIRAGSGGGFTAGFFDGAADIGDLSLEDSRLKSIIDSKSKTPLDLMQEDFPSTPSALFSNRGSRFVSGQDVPVPGSPTQSNPSGAPPAGGSSGLQQSPTAISKTSSGSVQIGALHDDDDGSITDAANGGFLAMTREFIPQSELRSSGAGGAYDPMLDAATAGIAQMSVSGPGGYAPRGTQLQQQQSRGVAANNGMYAVTNGMQQPQYLQQMDMGAAAQGYGYATMQQGIYQQQYMSQQEAVLGSAPNQYYVQQPGQQQGGGAPMYGNQMYYNNNGMGGGVSGVGSSYQSMTRGQYMDQSGSAGYGMYSTEQQLPMGPGGAAYWDGSNGAMMADDGMGFVPGARSVGQQQARGMYSQQGAAGMNVAGQMYGASGGRGGQGGGMIAGQGQQMMYGQGMMQQQMMPQQMANGGNQMMYGQGMMGGMDPMGMGGQRMAPNGMMLGPPMGGVRGDMMGKDRRGMGGMGAPMGRGGMPARGKPMSGGNPMGGMVANASVLGAAAAIRDPLVEEFRNTFGKSKQWEIKDLTGHIVAFCQDQHGSRFIQQRLEVAPDAEKQLVFDELLPCAQSLMTDVFGNYVIQKLFEFGNPDQCEMLAQMLTGQAVVLALQMYGCRVIQKALEYVNTDRLVALVSEFEGQQVLRCVHDQNGNHVIQKCIEVVCRVSRDANPAMAEFLSSKIQFIISAFHGRVRELSMHPYGCRVVQRILEHCSNAQKAPVLEELRKCCNELVQDQYGNYVIQHVMQHGWEADKAMLVREVQSRLLEYSQHKFASNVVEKCLQYANRKDRDEMIWTIINVTFDLNSPVDANTGQCVLESMVRDPYANYVVQKVIDVSDERQRAAIVRYVKENIVQLRRYTYGKHIIVRLEKVYGEKF